MVEAAIDLGVHERLPLSALSYVGFVDPSGGSNDSMTLAIAHREGSRIVVDALREAFPPFNPDDVVRDFADLLKRYRIRKVQGDRYAGEWPRERFKVHGIAYEPSAKPKSDLYRDLLPRLNAGEVALLDFPGSCINCSIWSGGRRGAVATASIIRRMVTTTWRTPAPVWWPS